MYTLVTGFFDIGREHWRSFQRPMSKYFDNARRVLSLHNDMVVFIQPDLVDFVAQERKSSLFKTVIIPTPLQALPYYKYKKEIKEIMESEDFRKDLALPSCPEVCKPLYNVVMWSKLALIKRAIDMKKFESTHYAWIDFGLHTHILRDEMLNRPLLSNIPDKIKLLKLSEPKQSDLNIKKFYKSHTVRFAGGLITGSVENLQLFQQYFDAEVEECLKQRVVDSDQALFNSVYLKHPELFQVYAGGWGDLISRYYNER